MKVSYCGSISFPELRHCLIFSVSVSIQLPAMFIPLLFLKTDLTLSFLMNPSEKKNLAAMDSIHNKMSPFPEILVPYLLSLFLS